MRHEEYIGQLAEGFAGDPRAAREPEYSGHSIPDAIARWIGFTVSLYAQDRCRFATRDGRLLDVSFARTHARWGVDGQEDVEITIAGFREGREAQTHALRITVRPHAGRCFLRLHDESTRRVVDREGILGKQEGRWRVDEPGEELFYGEIRTRRQRRRPSVVRLESCCRNTLRRISLARHLGTAAEGLETWSSLGFEPGDPTSYASSSTGGLAGDLDVIAQDTIQELVRAELLIHTDPTDPLHVRWTAVGRAFGL